MNDNEHDKNNGAVINNKYKGNNNDYYRKDNKDYKDRDRGDQRDKQNNK